MVGLVEIFILQEQITRYLRVEAVLRVFALLSRNFFRKGENLNKPSCNLRVGYAQK